jgi:D-glycero-alpha-D-manno-heptose-7-phosphate kinase
MKQSYFTISKTSTIRDAFICINKNKLGIVFITNHQNQVIGCATDGDIRSCLLDHFTLADSIESVFNPNFVWRRDTDSRESILKLLDSQIKAIPILDSDSRLVDVITSSQFPVLIEQDVFARSKAPVRISFAGGGSDLTHYFRAEGEFGEFEGL